MHQGDREANTSDKFSLSGFLYVVYVYGWLKMVINSDNLSDLMAQGVEVHYDNNLDPDKSGGGGGKLQM